LNNFWQLVPEFWDHTVSFLGPIEHQVRDIVLDTNFKTGAIHSVPRFIQFLRQ